MHMEFGDLQSIWLLSTTCSGKEFVWNRRLFTALVRRYEMLFTLPKSEVSEWHCSQVASLLFEQASAAFTCQGKC